MSVLSQHTSAIKKIQRGTVTLVGTVSQTATISAVNMAKTTVSFLGFTTTYSDLGHTGVLVDRYMGRVELTNSTTITGYKQSTSNNITISFEVIEYY